MTGRLKIHLKANERLFVNGGVLQVDRKVAIEFLNGVMFLLQAHVMQIEEATTPLRQLYYVVQSMIIDPVNGKALYRDYSLLHKDLIIKTKDQDVLAILADVEGLVGRGRPFDALKRIRVLIKSEERVM